MDDNLISCPEPAAFKMKRDARGESLATPRRGLGVFREIGNRRMRRDVRMVTYSSSGRTNLDQRLSVPRVSIFHARESNSHPTLRGERVARHASGRSCPTVVVVVVVLVVVVFATADTRAKETRSSAMAAALKILRGQGRVFASIFQIARRVRALASSHSSS